MARGTFLKLAGVVAILPLLGAGCVERAQERAQAAGGSLGHFVKQAQEETLNAIDDTSRRFIKRLSGEQKEAIDGWLASNRLNVYGDTKDTVYAGGTPLFDETTGATADRFEYLFKKFPQLRDIVESSVQEQLKK